MDKESIPHLVDELMRGLADAEPSGRTPRQELAARLERAAPGDAVSAAERATLLAESMQELLPSLLEDEDDQSDLAAGPDELPDRELAVKVAEALAENPTFREQCSSEKVDVSVAAAASAVFFVSSARAAARLATGESSESEFWADVERIATGVLVFAIDKVGEPAVTALFSRVMPLPVARASAKVATTVMKRHAPKLVKLASRGIRKAARAVRTMVVKVSEGLRKIWERVKWPL
jgi:hypothetical protein